MAYIDSVATLVDELDDVETKFCSHNFRHLLRVVQTESYIGKLGHPLVATRIAQLSAVAGRTVLGIDFGEG